MLFHAREIYSVVNNVATRGKGSETKILRCFCVIPGNGIISDIIAFIQFILTLVNVYHAPGTR